MTGHQQFEDVLVWKKTKTLVVDVYRAIAQSRDYGFRDQLQRAAVSIMNNIAEGHERQGDREFAQFLYIAKGSCGEVRSMLHLALDLGYIDQQQYKDLVGQTIEISRMLGGFVKKLREPPRL